MNDHEREGAAGRAFVVQFLLPDDGDAIGFRGRVERVASGESRRFQSADELLDFMRQKLALTGDGSDGAQTAGSTGGGKEKR